MSVKKKLKEKTGGTAEANEFKGQLYFVRVSAFFIGYNRTASTTTTVKKRRQNPHEIIKDKGIGV